MMLDKEIEELLEEAFCAEYEILQENFPIYRGGLKTSVWGYRRAKMTTERICAETGYNLYPTAWEHIAYYEGKDGFPCALVIDEENRMVLVGGSGMAKLNPAVVEILFKDDCVEMTAWAKEGLIKQKTAQKALSACVRVLGLTLRE